MRHLHSLLALVVLAVGCTHDARQDASPDGFNVLSYNIHHAEGTDGRLDLERIARIITRNHVDLAAIQEVDVNTKRVPVDECAELARLTGMHATFGKAIDYQGGSYGQVILSRFAIANPRTYALPSRPDKEQRIALAVTVSPGDGRPEFRFVSTHLDHQSNSDRVAQADKLLGVLAAEPPAPTILAGDFNSAPQSGPMSKVFTNFTDTAGNAWVPTVPATSPKIKIDFILTSKKSPWIPTSSSVLNEPIASDHRPVIAHLTWSTQGNP